MNVGCLGGSSASEFIFRTHFDLEDFVDLHRFVAATGCNFRSLLSAENLNIPADRQHSPVAGERTSRGASCEDLVNDQDVGVSNMNRDSRNEVAKSKFPETNFIREVSF